MLYLPVKLLLRYCFNRRELVDTGVVHQDIEPPKRILCLGKEPLDVILLCHVGLHRDCFSAALRNFIHHAICAFFRGGIVHDDIRAFCGQLFGDFGADSLRGPGHNCDLVR